MALGFLTAALGRVFFHEGQDERIEDFFLLVKYFGAISSLLCRYQLLLDPQKLSLIFNHSGVQQSSTHANLMLFSEKILNLAQIVTFESAERLP